MHMFVLDKEAILTVCMNCLENSHTIILVVWLSVYQIFYDDLQDTAIVCSFRALR